MAAAIRTTTAKATPRPMPNVFVVDGGLEAGLLLAVEGLGLEVLATVAVAAVLAPVVVVALAA
jgi:hypothetical protein